MKVLRQCQDLEMDARKLGLTTVPLGLPSPSRQLFMAGFWISVYGSRGHLGQ